MYWGASKMRNRTRKIIVLLVAIGIIFSLGGCKKSNSIVGKWQDKKDIVEFKSDGSFKSQYYWGGGAYTVSKNKLTLSPTMLNKEDYTYEIDNNGDLILKGKQSYHFTSVK